MTQAQQATAQVPPPQEVEHKVYFLDQEFSEGIDSNGRHFIDLIQIGLVCDDGREYEALCSEYSYEEANDWVKKNVIKPLFKRTMTKMAAEGKCTKVGEVWYEDQGNDQRDEIITEKDFHRWFGKARDVIRMELLEFTGCELTGEELRPGLRKNQKVRFYGYYADYDWVLFCSLFGRMIDLPEGFPMYCRDLKQELDRVAELLYPGVPGHEAMAAMKLMPNWPVQDQADEHDALLDAQWNKRLYDWLNELMDRPKEQVGLLAGIERLINQHGREKESDTPDFLLAEYLYKCLINYEVAAKARDQWFGIAPWDGKKKEKVQQSLGKVLMIDMDKVLRQHGVTTQEELTEFLSKVKSPYANMPEDYDPRWDKQPNLEGVVFMTLGMAAACDDPYRVMELGNQLMTEIRKSKTPDYQSLTGDPGLEGGKHPDMVAHEKALLEIGGMIFGRLSTDGLKEYVKLILDGWQIDELKMTKEEKHLINDLRRAKSSKVNQTDSLIDAWPTIRDNPSQEGPSVMVGPAVWKEMKKLAGDKGVEYLPHPKFDVGDKVTVPPKEGDAGYKGPGPLASKAIGTCEIISQKYVSVADGTGLPPSWWYLLAFTLPGGVIEGVDNTTQWVPEGRVQAATIEKINNDPGAREGKPSQDQVVMRLEGPSDIPKIEVPGGWLPTDQRTADDPGWVQRAQEHKDSDYDQ